MSRVHHRGQSLARQCRPSCSSEDDRLDPSKDSADFIKGLIGSYPNYFFDMREEDLPDFFDLLAHFDKSPKDLAAAGQIRHQQG